MLLQAHRQRPHLLRPRGAVVLHDDVAGRALLPAVLAAVPPAADRPPRKPQQHRRSYLVLQVAESGRQEPTDADDGRQHSLEFGSRRCGRIEMP